MEEKVKIKLVVGTLTSVLIILGFALFRIFSVSTRRVVLYPLDFFNSFLSMYSASGPSDAMLASITEPLFFLAPLLPIALAFCVLVFYGLHYGEDRRFCMVACLFPSVLGAFVSGLSLTSLFFILAMVVCGFLVSPLAIMYLRELKKWKKYRIGSRTVGKCFLLINLFLFFALFADVFINLDDYNSAYSQEAESFVMKLLPDMGASLPQIEGMELLPPEQQQDITQEYERLNEDQKNEVARKVGEMFQSENMSALINMSLFFTPMMVFAILETLRMLVLSPVAGLATGVALRQIKN